MSSEPPDISVVVCTYTEARWDDLVESVESLQRQTQCPGEVIVVVDHNPALHDRAKEQLRGVVVTENQEQQGLSGGRNSGIAVANGDVIAFLDDDAMAAPDWIEKLKSGYENEQVLGVGGSILPLWQTRQPGWFPDEFKWVVGCTYRGLPSVTSPVRNFIGCNMSFRSEVFESVGGFRHDIGRVGTRPLGCEETELCIRTSQHFAEGVLLYEPESKVYHRVPHDRVSWSYFRNRCYSEGISKALIAKYIGSDDGLNSERSYVVRTLPLGVKRGLTDAITRFKPSGLARAAAIVAGTAFTAAGYIRGSISG